MLHKYFANLLKYARQITNAKPLKRSYHRHIIEVLFWRVNTFLCYAKALNHNVTKKRERKWSCLIFKVFRSVCVSGQAGDVRVVFIKPMLHRMKGLAAGGEYSNRKHCIARTARTVKVEFRISSDAFLLGSKFAS